MKKAKPSTPPPRPSTERLTRIGSLTAWISLGSFFYYLGHGEILMHGDAVAHINIARRVFDSLNPGPLQLGTVWLPLPHLLMIPFLLSSKMWQSGVGGSVPSMIAFVFGAVGILRLSRGLFVSAGLDASTADIGGFFAAFVYAANPNLMYVQATALTEPLCVAFFIWAASYFADFLIMLGTEAQHTEGRRGLLCCALCVACAELTRYDGWFLGAVTGTVVLAIVLGDRQNLNDRRFRRSLGEFLAVISLAPALWLAYNAVVYGSAWAFANGPYSAQAIEARVHAPNPAAHDLWASVSYFLKSAQITLAVGNWGRFWLAAAVLASVILARKLPRRVAAVLLVLWSPVAFYALSIAYGSVPLHVPMWWPFAIFNQRFGLELLPLFAVAAGALVALATRVLPLHKWRVVGSALALVMASYAFVWVAKPLCWQEAWRNWQIRRGLEMSVEGAIKEFPADSLFMMDLGEHVGIMERLGIPLRRVINGQDHRLWLRPSDPQGAWERALADPGKYVNYVIIFEGDSVDRGVNRDQLTLLEVIHATGEPPARIYITPLPPNQVR